MHINAQLKLSINWLRLIYIIIYFSRKKCNEKNWKSNCNCDFMSSTERVQNRLLFEWRKIEINFWDKKDYLYRKKLGKIPKAERNRNKNFKLNEINFITDSFKLSFQHEKRLNPRAGIMFQNYYRLVWWWFFYIISLKLIIISQ